MAYPYVVMGHMMRTTFIVRCLKQIQSTMVITCVGHDILKIKKVLAIKRKSQRKVNKEKSTNHTKPPTNILTQPHVDSTQFKPNVFGYPNVVILAQHQFGHYRQIFSNHGRRLHVAHRFDKYIFKFHKHIRVVMAQTQQPQRTFQRGVSALFTFRPLQRRYLIGAVAGRLFLKRPQRVWHFCFVKPKANQTIFKSFTVR